ncbi:hypothetical protein GUJ93_ZPchr0293g2872 [Zizania palustris]|uniref:Uncharacterized protein n=1 Tax=Zizania palustris TaxID=103762 RepID=A0A8J5X607_ZIZPA|nr:hypothetical protein GUJ93_ZPchr0293g2872 [Zizania palustris]
MCRGRASPSLAGRGGGIGGEVGVRATRQGVAAHHPRRLVEVAATTVRSVPGLHGRVWLLTIYDDVDVWGHL